MEALPEQWQVRSSQNGGSKQVRAKLFLISIQFISVSNECLTITINVFVMVGKFRHKENSQKLSHLVENVLTRISGYHFQAGNNFWG
jgi:hypothetical protein